MPTIATFDQLPLLLPESGWAPPTELPRVRGCRRLALDTETCDPTLSDLGPGFRRGAYVVGISLATDDGRTCYLPFKHQDGGNLDAGVVRRWALAELNQFDGELVGANLLYDLEALSTLGVTFPFVKRFLDVQVAEPLIDENRPSFKLDVLAHDYLGVGKDETLLREAAAAYGARTEKQIKSNLWRYHSRYVGPYAEADADLPLRIIEKQLKIIEEQDLGRVFDLETRLIPLLLMMRQRGVRVDVQGAARVREQLDGERRAAIKELKRLAGPQAELMAPESFASALIEAGLDVPRTAKTKKPSVTKGWLQANAGKHPIVDAVLAGRRVDYIINTFIDGHIFTHAVNGRIHCQFNQLKSDDEGTIARFSSSYPNLQNIPARDPVIGPLVRGLFLPDEGEKWGRDDYSQIEYRFLVHYASGEGSDRARQMYHDNPRTDFHKMCAGFLGIDPEDPVKRKPVKNVNFCKVYGGGAAKIALMMNCSLEEAQAFIEKYDRELPFVNATAERAARTANDRGFITTILGRRQRFYLWEPPKRLLRRDPQLAALFERHGPLRRTEAEAVYGSQGLVLAYTYAALNRALQAGAADLMKTAMVKAHEAGIFDVIGVPLVTVHDELGNSVNPDRKDHADAFAELGRVLATALTLRVPILAERQVKDNWGECK